MFIFDLCNVKIYFVEMGGLKIKVKYFGIYERMCFLCVEIIKMIMIYENIFFKFIYIVCNYLGMVFVIMVLRLKYELK